MVLGEGEQGSDVYVLSVKEHKTSVKGAARLMLTADDWPKLLQYVQVQEVMATRVEGDEQLDGIKYMQLEEPPTGRRHGIELALHLYYYYYIIYKTDLKGFLQQCGATQTAGIQYGAVWCIKMHRPKYKYFPPSKGK